MKGLIVLSYVILLIIIVFLAFQVNDNSGKCRQSQISDQDRLTAAARLMLQSATQQHDLFALQHAQEAKLIVDELIRVHGGITGTEKDLRLQKGRLEKLKNQIDNQFSDTQAAVMEKLIKVHPGLDIPENEAAGLNRKKRKSSSKR